MSEESKKRGGLSAGPLGSVEALVVDSGYHRLSLDRLAQQGTALLGAERSCILVDDRAGAPVVVAAHGVDDDALGLQFPASGDVGGVPIILALEPAADATGAVLQVAFSGSGAQGVFQVAGRQIEAPTHADAEDVVGAIASLAASALDHSTIPGRLRKSLLGEVEELARIADTRGDYDVSIETSIQLATRAATHLALGPADIIEIAVASRLQNVALFALSEVGVSTEGLDRDDAELVREHAQAGADMLAHVPGLEPVATLVRYHHERFDGTGAPHGLSGDRIPAGSRIMAVCEAFRALLSRRPHRGGTGAQAAFAELETGAGTIFDPAVLAAIREVMPEALAEAFPRWRGAVRRSKEEP